MKEEETSDLGHRFPFSDQSPLARVDTGPAKVGGGGDGPPLSPFHPSNS